MFERVENCNVVELKPLVAPNEIKASLPISERASALVLETRHAIRDAIHGRDPRRQVLVVGPCSIHDPESSFEYARRLQKVAEATRGELIVVMRAYFEKPRTTVGWKGLINDPHLDGSCDLEAGLRLARQVLLEIAGMGMPCACEMLDPVTPQYVADLVAWAAIGARTTESQTHRQMASGLSMPVGFKNGTDGSLQVALNAMISARHAHSFLGINGDGMTCVVKTTGNPDRHVVLRGGVGRPNYMPLDVAHAASLVKEEGLARPVMVDCSHDNSNKDHTRQAAVCRAVLQQIRDGQKALLGLCLESHLQPGSQKWKEGVPLKYGVSITDACMGWEETEALLYEAAEAVKERALTPA